MNLRTLLPSVLLACACHSAPPPCPPVAPTADCPAVKGAAPPVSPAPAATSPADAVTLEERPGWTDKYAHVNVGDMRFFDIDGVMQAHGLDRALAVEVQNHFRDLSRDGTGSPTAWFNTAVERAKAAKFEDRRDVAKLKSAPFIVVFDLDETLYDQYYPADVGKTCHDLALPHKGKQRYVALAPGWAKAIRKVNELGGAVVIFSANTDTRTIENLAAWTLDDKPLTEHPAISGVLTNSHLVLQSKARGTPVVEPSKDLRIFDESLERVVIIDDNPTRLFQNRNARATYPFDAEAYCRASAGDMKRRATDGTLATIVEEIASADAYRKNAKVPFATAYLPFTIAGRIAVEAAMAAGKSREQALTWVRRHPELVD
jgi:NLI interacting factor-like phosphatase